MPDARRSQPPTSSLTSARCSSSTRSPDTLNALASGCGWIPHYIPELLQPFPSGGLCGILTSSRERKPLQRSPAMTFDDILEQVITLLKRQGRVSYRALKMRFNLDDEYLDVLKEELLYVHPVRDDEGKGLVWTGAVEGTVATPSPPPQPIQPSPGLQEEP